MIKAKYLKLICETISTLELDETERKIVAESFASALEGTNPGFDRDRFIQECEPKEQR